MKKLAVVVTLIMLAALVGIGIVGAALINGRPSINRQGQAQNAGDTASIYFSDLYQAEGEFPLYTWQPITVFGETFTACVVQHLGGRSTLTVNPDDSRLCGDR
jgi:hypothetical protein